MTHSQVKLYEDFNDAVGKNGQMSTKMREDVKSDRGMRSFFVCESYTQDLNNAK